MFTIFQYVTHHVILILFQLYNIYPLLQIRIGRHTLSVNANPIYQLVYILCIQVTFWPIYNPLKCMCNICSRHNNDAFHFVMAGLPGLLALLLNHRKIQAAVGYGGINITTFHNRPHLFPLDDNKSRIDQDIDHMKLLALLVDNARHLEHEVTTSGINSVTYENKFTPSIGQLKKPGKEVQRGRYCYIKISEETDLMIKAYSFDYYIVTIKISDSWRIHHGNGPHFQHNPNQGLIDFRLALKS